MSTSGTKLLVLFASFVLSACSTVDVTTDYDRSAAFQTYRTYSIAPGPDGRDLPAYCERTLRNVIRSELAARGVTETAGPTADLAIVWHVYLADSTTAHKVSDAGAGWVYEYGRYGLWSDASPKYANTAPYPDGTLILDVVDMHTETLVFRGTGTAVAMGPKRGAKNIEKAVKKMVAALPTKH